MKEAIRQAKKAASIGEVPIGCVIEYEGKIIGRGYNRRMADHTVLAHAEIIAIRKACKKMGDWRLEDCTMYVTLEPCPMCAGAIVQARIPRVVIGSMNPKAGCAGSVLDMLHEKGFNHQADTEIGVLGEECSAMLSDFFRELRAKKKAKKDLALANSSAIESVDHEIGGKSDKNFYCAADHLSENEQSQTDKRSEYHSPKI